MDRLTRRINGEVCLQRGIEWGGVATYKLQEDARKRLADYEDTELTPEEVTALKSIKNWADTVENELNRFIHAEKEERLILLPCKVTDTVYIIEGVYKGRKLIDEKVVPAKIDRVIIGGTTGKPVYDLCTEPGSWFLSMQPGDFFLTREEAEKEVRKGRETR